MNKFFETFKFIPAQWGHWLAPAVLPFVKADPNCDFVWNDFYWKGLYFRNRLGIAGGVDKNAVNILDWQRLGCGFLEIGTVTPLAQKPNPGKIIDRDWQKNLLWNKMGFPNDGADEVLFNVLRQQEDLKLPLFVNIGKNRQTPNDESHRDYAAAAERLNPIADAFVINVSSPNTKDLRVLQKADGLKTIIESVMETVGSRPVFVKLSPDLSEQDFSDTVNLGISYKIGGFILTNTTTSRINAPDFPTEGGLSGSCLKEISRNKLSTAHRLLGDRRKDFLLVSVGGVTDCSEVKIRLDLGADLVQSYSGLVFNGPYFFQQCYDHFTPAKDRQL
jgi:dihydroorotate dehydrogenase